MRFAPLITVAVCMLAAQAFAGEVQMPGFHLQHRSSFTTGSIQRPFTWPIGYVHRDKAAVVAEKVIPKLTPDMFIVTSILGGPPPIAVINGRPYAEGDMVYKTSPELKALGKNAHVLVKLIQEGAVVLACEDQQVKVDIKRKEATLHDSSPAQASHTEEER